MMPSPDAPPPPRLTPLANAGSPRRSCLLTGLILFAVAVGLGNVLLFAYGLMLPRRWQVHQEIDIAASPERVFAELETPRAWKQWSPWGTHMDPSLEYGTEGPERGPGAVMYWVGRQSGTGRLTLLESSPANSVVYTLNLQGQPFSDGGRFWMHERTGRGRERQTRVVWTDEGPLGDTIARIFGGKLQASLADEYAVALTRLKHVCESNPLPADDP